MDGSYLRPDGRGQPSLPTQSSTADGYKANVNRSKTKKWVEAKSQNYDGDDWGGDEYEDEDDEPEPPLPKLPVVQDQLPSQRAASQTYAPPPAAVPALQVHTQQPVGHDITSPVSDLSGHSGSSRPAVGQSVVSPASASTSANQSFGADRESTGAAPNAPAGKAPAFIRPSDIYKRLEAERERERLSSDGPRPPMEALTGDQARDRSASPSKASLPQPTSPQAPGNSHLHQPQPQTPRQFESVGSSFDVHELDSKRISVSPKLPDLARMSAFGPDLFNTPPNLDSAPPMPAVPLPTHPEEIKPEASIPATVPEAVEPVEAKVTSDASTSSPEIAKSSTEGASKTDESPAEESSKAASALPLRTSSMRPEPHRDVTPTEPLQLRKGSSPPETFEPEPRPIGRQPTFGTDTSSPVKESDVLREEIMRTLSPVATDKAVMADASGPETSKERKGTRDSTYTLQDYDSYWADADDKPPVPQSQPSNATPFGMAPVHEDEAVKVESVQTEVPKTEATEKQVSEDVEPPNAEGTKVAAAAEVPAPIIQEPIMHEPIMAEPVMAEPVVAADPHKESSSVSSGAIAAGAVATAGVVGATAAVAAKGLPTNPKQNLRRRFSWEDGGANDNAPEESEESASIPTVTAPIDSTAAKADTSAPLAAKGVEHAESSAPAITVAPVDSQPPPPEYIPSPAPEQTRASMVSDGSGAPIEREESRLSLADEKALAQTSSTSLVAPSPPPEAHPALSTPSSSPKPSQPSMTFREIMDLGSPKDRIAKFNESRVSFATNEIGLHQWLVTLQSDHPEHVSRTVAASRPPGDGTVPPIATGTTPAVQQPYYQQYLNASSPSSQSPTSRSRLAGLSIPSTGGSSSFGHSSNQIGTKGKELMQSAGKMGKGLLSKGKIKLRGSGGDKGESASSQVQPKLAKSDRRGSWALNLGPKLKTNDSSLQPQGPPQPQLPVHVSRIDPAPQLPEPAPLSPFASDSPVAERTAWPPPPGPTTDSLKPAHVASTAPTAAPQPVADDWVVVPREERPPVPSKSPVEATMNRGLVSNPPAATTAVVTAAAASSAAAVATATGNTEDAPRRQSSFVGLPPIRRSSTFGLSKAKKAKERFPLDGDDEDESFSALMEQTIPEQQATEADLSDDSRQGDVMMVDPDAKQSPTQEKKELVVTETEVPSIVAPQSNISDVGIQHPNAAAPAHQPQQQAFQRAPPVGAWKLEESHLSEPLNQVTRNRSGTGGSQGSPGFYGFDKDTGLPNPIPPNSQQMPPSLKQRATEMPPSSAQRYPDLFAARPGQPNTGYPDEYGYQVPHSEASMNPRRISSEYSIPGVGPPSDERGRSKRNSGIFRDIGNKIARATSRERRGSNADQSLQVQDMRRDSASDSSFAQDDSQNKQKRRSSLFMTLSGRASMDQGLDRPPPVGIQRAQTDMMPGRPDSQSERKKSFFGGLASAQQKFTSATSRQSFSSGRMNQSTEDVTETTPKKKRFSDMSKMFRRSQHPDQPSDGRRGSIDASQMLSSNQGVSRAEQYAADDFLGSQRSPDQPASSFDIAPPSAPQGHAPRNRRGSVSDFLTNLVGRKTETKHSEQLARPEPPMFLSQQSNEASSFANIPQPPTEKLNSRPQSGQDQSITPDAVEADQKRISQQLAPPTHSRPTSFGQGVSLTDRSNIRDAPEEPRRPLSFERHDDSETSFATARSSQDHAAKQDVTSAPVAREAPRDGHPTASAIDEQSQERSFTIDTQDMPTASTQHQSYSQPGTVQPVKDSVDESKSIVSRQDTDNTTQSLSDASPAVSSVPSSFRGNPGPPTGGQMGQPAGPNAQYRHPYGGAAPQQWQQRPDQGPASPDMLAYGGQRPSFASQQSASSQLSPGAGRGQYVPPYQPNAPRASYDQQPAAAGVQGAPPSGKSGEGAMSKLKGIRNRMSEQMSNIAQGTGTRDEKGDSSGKTDRLSGNKILGAFKRTSKQAEPASFSNQTQQRDQQEQWGQNRPPPPPSAAQGHTDAPGPRRMMTMQEYQAQQSPTGYSEPRYDSVPIPQGYSAVQGQGNAVPSQYQVPRQTYQGQSHASGYGQQQFSPQQMTSPHHAPSPHASQYPQHSQHAQNAQHMHGATQQRENFSGYEEARTQLTSPPVVEQPFTGADNKDSEEDLSPTKTDSPHTSVSREQSELGFLQPGGGLTVKRSGSEHSQVSAISAAPMDPPKVNERPDLSINTELHPSPSSANAVTEASKAEPLSHDAADEPAEAKTPTGESPEDDRPGTAKASSNSHAKQLAQTSFTAELDDTEDAHKRSARLASQEEKIFYEPEAEPTMSATSYPGDEWNPYGEFAYGDWKDE